MASRRKSFTPPVTPGPPRDDDPSVYSAFVAAMLNGTIVATKAVEVRKGNGRLRLDYDDPNG